MEGGERNPIVINALGKCRVSIAGALAHDLPPKVAELLVLLLLHHGNPINKSAIKAEIWFASESIDVDQTYRKHLSLLRDHLGDTDKTLVVSTRRGDVHFESGNAIVDFTQFENAMTRAIKSKKSTEILQAIGLYTADLLPATRVARLARERDKLRGLFQQGVLIVVKGLLRAEEREHAKNLVSAALSTSPEAEDLLMFMLSTFDNDAQTGGRVYRAYADARQIHGFPNNKVIEEAYRKLKKKSAPRPPKREIPKHKLYQVPSAHTRLIGRKDAMESLSQRLTGSRVVILTGAPGVGKTRLAIEAATSHCDLYANGTVFVDLTFLERGASKNEVYKAIHHNLNLPDGEPDARTAVIACLDSCHLLLILDGAEHVSLAVAAVTREIVDICKNIAVLVTSQTELAHGLGAVSRIPPFSLMELRNLPWKDLREADAVRMLAEASDVNGHKLAATDGNHHVMVELLESTGGLPLAIEDLASESAASLDELRDCVMSLHPDDPQQIENPIPISRFVRTDTAIARSFSLLGDAEKTALACLSVFSGGWYREAAELVLTGIEATTSIPGDVFSLLVRRSLVHRTEIAGKSRYMLLAPIARYASCYLRNLGLIDTLKAMHLSYFVSRVEEIARIPISGALTTAIQRLTPDLDNLKSAFNFSLESGKNDEALRLATGLLHYFYTCGLLAEGEEWYERIIDARIGASEQAHWQALHCVGVIAFNRHDYERAYECWQLCAALSEAAGDEIRQTQDWGNLGNAARVLGRYARAKELFRLALERYRQRKSWRGVAKALGNLALVARAEHEYDAALSLFTESIEAFREHQDDFNLALSLNNLASTLIEAGSLDRAISALDEAVCSARRIDNLILIAHSFTCYVHLAVLSCDWERSAVIMAAEKAIRVHTGVPLPLEAQTQYQEWWVETRKRLGRDLFAARQRMGSDMSIADACRYVRSVGAGLGEELQQSELVGSD